MESPPTMVLHGAIIALVLYYVLKFLRIPHATARAYTVGALSVAYMVNFGHKLPRV